MLLIILRSEEEFPSPIEINLNEYRKKIPDLFLIDFKALLKTQKIK